MSLNLHVSIEDLASTSGLIPGQEASARNLSRQLGLVQALPSNQQYKTYHEFAAKYLPALVEKFKSAQELGDASALMLNAIAFTPYFVRFSHTPAGSGLAAIHAQRLLAAKDTFNPRAVSFDEIAETTQFLSTLMLLQGLDDIPEAVRKDLSKEISQWLRTMPEVFAAETCDRCLTLLEDSPETRPMMQMVKMMLEKSLNECGAPGCGRKVQSDGSAMLQCSRCKTAVYCGQPHQKAAWSSHKAPCYASAF